MVASSSPETSPNTSSWRPLPFASAVLHVKHLGQAVDHGLGVGIEQREQANLGGHRADAIEVVNHGFQHVHAVGGGP